MDTPEDTETPNQDTPDPYAGAQRYIEDARDQLREGYNTYINQADGASSLVDVGVDVEFNSFDVTDELDRAENPIANAEASRTNDEQEATIRDLKAFRTAIEVFAEVQADLGRGPDDMEDPSVPCGKRLREGHCASEGSEYLDLLDNFRVEFRDSTRKSLSITEGNNGGHLDLDARCIIRGQPIDDVLLALCHVLSFRMVSDEFALAVDDIGHAVGQALSECVICKAAYEHLIPMLIGPNVEAHGVVKSTIGDGS